MVEGPRYVIPKPTRRTYELLPGWGLVEFALIGAGTGIGALLTGLGTLLSLPIPIDAIAGLLPVAVGGFLAFPPPTGEPLYRQALAAWAYRKAPRCYVYDWTAGDEEPCTTDVPTTAHSSR